MVVEKLSCFEIAAFFTHYVGEGNKAVISKQERFSTTLSHSYIVFTLGRSYIVFTVVKSESNDVSVIYEAFIFAKNVLITLGSNYIFCSFYWDHFVRQRAVRLSLPRPAK